MQKFVKSNSKNTGVMGEPASLHPSQVKLVGYLKKKRTKVGGWRKMWFVLQNQLLLSYPSKEDYDKKLVSFKDVLNLVPGTIVRPLGGYRFAIQTTSESVFIFRCDDNKTYMEWITALVDSLSIGSKVPKKKNNLGGTMIKKPLQGSHSCSSLVRSKKNKAVHIPIVHGTARILNRTGLSENDLRAFSLRDNIERSTNHFCLHETQLLLHNQSNEVSRINLMFCSSASDVDASSSIHHAGSGDKGFTLKPTSRREKLADFKEIHCESDGDSEISHKSVMKRKMHQLLNFIKPDSNTMVGDEIIESEILKDINANEEKDNKKFSKIKSKEQNDELLKVVEGNTLIEDQVQRLSLRGSSSLKIEDDRKTELKDEDINYLRLSSSIRTKERSPFSRHRKRIEQGCSSSTGSCSPSVRRNETQCSGDVSEICEDVDISHNNEPIYAVVNLKNKYERRARIRGELEEKRKSLIGYLKGLDEATTDYEEVLEFPNDLFDDKIDNAGNSYDEENIYEPINIPETSCRNRKHRNVIWKYIKSINIDALFELARNKKKAVKPPEHTSPFANIRQKIGHHRKSIRIRMIKLYTRDQTTEESVEIQGSGDRSQRDQLES